jgi:hypothetical protein
VGVKSRRAYRRAVKRLATWSFPVWQRLGIHVVANDHASPIPDTRTLPPTLWSARSELIGIDVNEERQLELLRRFRDTYRVEYDAFPRGPGPDPRTYHVDNGSFESVDGEVLYCMIREFRPGRIIEVGSGHSTLVAAQAVLRNASGDARGPCDFVAIEPHPNELLLGGFPGLSRLVRREVQDVPLREFEALRENDILFIDSSHVLKAGSDVRYLLLEVLPRLAPGVLVHVHDVFLPSEYPREWVLRHRRFYTEQYLLHAFLLFNRAFAVLWSASYLHLNHPEELEAAFASYGPKTRWPGSLWMRRVA